MENSFESLVSEFCGSKNKDSISMYHRSKLIKRLRQGRFRISLHRLPDYLKIAKELGFIDTLVFKMLLAQIVNLDLSIGIEYDSYDKQDWSLLLEEAWREVSLAEWETSPISSGESVSLSGSLSEDSLRSKVVVLLKGAQALFNHCRECMNDGLFVVLMEVFEEKILPSYGLMVSQFILFSGISIDRRNMSNFVSFLNAQIFTGFSPLREKQIVYLSSFLASVAIVDTSLHVISTGFVEKAGERMLLETDRISGVLLYALMHISMAWHGSVCTKDIDRVILRVSENTRLVGMVKPQIQTMYQKIVPAFVPQLKQEHIVLSFPFEASPIPYIHDWIQNYKYK
ncbi:hypothetical protein NEHOM01_0802 [Nematocida homosporus]|uniref:uncharacterized protein n=1 Tax=Nematocida homosporus TaxID=1912981 RepID=UPI002220894B|nr:uncharacterized protein NEHOM01_0802 [Nematocida homosporus]KAI5185387.1 hypothetical protein NEHOM01_0802 [Nematocida homosporus]